MSSDFQTTTHGKWILAGEHAVIRGHAALILPIHDKTLTLHYQKSVAHEYKISTDFIEQPQDNFTRFFSNVIQHGMRLIGTASPAFYGQFHIKCSIPIGVGLGASAALCVAIARLFAAEAAISTEEINPFAHKLEHLFHGQSSGLDIAGASANTPIYFKQGVSDPIKQTWNPTWRLSSCGAVGTTSQCIEKVQLLWQQDPHTAAKIDEQMISSVALAKQTLEEEAAPQSKHILAKAMNKAALCFQQWGLIPTVMEDHITQLRNQGALAVKPTGSGGGGYVVSLWDE